MPASDRGIRTPLLSNEDYTIRVRLLIHRYPTPRRHLYLLFLALSRALDPVSAFDHIRLETYRSWPAMQFEE